MTSFPRWGMGCRLVRKSAPLKWGRGVPRMDCVWCAEARSCPPNSTASRNTLHPLRRAPSRSLIPSPGLTRRRPRLFFRLSVYWRAAWTRISQRGRQCSIQAFVSRQHRYLYVETPKAACTKLKHFIAEIEERAARSRSADLSDGDARHDADPSAALCRRADLARSRTRRGRPTSRRGSPAPMEFRARPQSL